MALIKCPECGSDISDKATSCPNCGYRVSKFKEAKKYIVIVAICLLAVIVIAILFNKTDKTQTMFDKINLQMSREQIHKTLGEPSKTFDDLGAESYSDILSLWG